MPITIRCLTCEAERYIEPTEPVWPFCANDECEAEYRDVVFALLDGFTLIDLGIDARSRFGKAAIAEVLRLKRQDLIERRESREMMHEIDNPPKRKLRPLYPVAIMLIPFCAAVIAVSVFA